MRKRCVIKRALRNSFLQTPLLCVASLVWLVLARPAIAIGAAPTEAVRLSLRPSEVARIYMWRAKGGGRAFVVVVVALVRCKCAQRDNAACLLCSGDESIR